MNEAKDNTLLAGKQNTDRRYIRQEMLDGKGNYIVFSHDMQEYRQTAELMKQSGYQLVELYYEDYRHYFENEFYSICPEMEIRMAIYAKCKCLTKGDSKCVVLLGGNRRIRTEQEQYFCNMVLKTLMTDVVGFSKEMKFSDFTTLVIDDMQFHINNLQEYFIKANQRNMRIILNIADMEYFFRNYTEEERNVIFENSGLRI